MTTEPTEKPANGTWAVTVSHAPPAQEAPKPAGGSWAVTVDHQPPVKHPVKTAGAAMPVKGKRVQPSAPKPLVKKADPPIDGGPSVRIKSGQAVNPAVPAEQADTPAAAGCWAVTVDHEQPAKPKTPVKIRHATPPPAPDAGEPLKTSPAKVKLLPVVICAAAVMLAGVGVTRHLSKRDAAKQQTAQAYATTTGFIARMDELKKQVPALQRQLDGPINDLKPVGSASAPSKDFKQRVDNAITTVKTVEKLVLDAETGEEQARQALAVLQEHAEYQSLSARVAAVSTEYKSLQQGVEAKCQTVRSLIMAANRRGLNLN